jgi:hypothetical protein
MSHFIRFNMPSEEEGNCYFVLDFVHVVKMRRGIEYLPRELVDAADGRVPDVSGQSGQGGVEIMYSRVADEVCEEISEIHI